MVLNTRGGARDEAMAAFTAAATLSASSRDANAEAHAWASAAGIHVAAGRLHDAIAALDRVIPVFERRGDDDALHTSLHNLAEIRLLLGRPDLARLAYEASQRPAARLGGRLVALEQQRLLLSIERAEGAEPGAIAARFEQLAAAYRDAGRPAEELQVCCELVHAELARGVRRDDALARAVELASEMGISGGTIADEIARARAALDARPT
jgi:tetratricopeptide (TPR) repeat protein